MRRRAQALSLGLWSGLSAWQQVSLTSYVALWVVVSWLSFLLAALGPGPPRSRRALPLALALGLMGLAYLEGSHAPTTYVVIALLLSLLFHAPEEPLPPHQLIAGLAAAWFASGLLSPAWWAGTILPALTPPAGARIVAGLAVVFNASGETIWQALSLALIPLTLFLPVALWLPKLTRWGALVGLGFHGGLAWWLDGWLGWHGLMVAIWLPLALPPTWRLPVAWRHPRGSSAFAVVLATCLLGALYAGTSTLAERHLRLAQEAWRHQDLDEVLAQTQLATQRRPGLRSAWALRADALMLRGEPQAALLAVARAAEHGPDPHNQTRAAALAAMVTEGSTDPTPALNLLCNEGVRSICGWIDSAGFVLPQTHEQALDLRCPKDSQACLALAQLHLRQAEPERAVEPLIHACQGSLGEGCALLAEQHLKAASGKSRVRARQLLQRSCALAHGPGCLGLGTLAQRGVGGPVDLQAAAQAFRQACEHGEATGCTQLALILADHGDAKGKLAALAQATRGCELGDALGCEVVKTLAGG